MLMSAWVVGADSDIVSWGTDGIDQNALAAPKIVLDPTGRHLHFHGKRVKIKMQIVKEHWGRDAIYLCPPYMIKNANMVATVLTMQLLRLRGDPTWARRSGRRSARWSSRCGGSRRSCSAHVRPGCAATARGWRGW